MCFLRVRCGGCLVFIHELHSNAFLQSLSYSCISIQCSLPFLLRIFFLFSYFLAGSLGSDRPKKVCLGFAMYIMLPSWLLMCSICCECSASWKNSKGIYDKDLLSLSLSPFNFHLVFILDYFSRLLS
ncbi:hypothetical protein P175DRAFT_0194957 [Aspergillus ochraceoroseus IBT 24754]|uniref:Uncharacterized protein n=1 Tax=Aspergillus ochraceoroseus IBT 24754 TaxID=1392256 RepID=A0A2T5LZH8_9EURO|nr:uncharacterized protein P175DRAFT_0194957 [Aspergillus ochraceoroseus IBT 24754]PTU21673.1 hypothetical protein P175DRAFT_0194957 [Aspergillus ochraceoroseus IBT 24754]